MLGDKMGNFISLYQSPNLPQDVFNHFIGDFELNLDSAVANNPFLVFVLSDLNAQTKTWFSQGKTI